MQDFMMYLKLNPMDKAHPVANKFKETDFRYLSMYSWIVLTNQIAKIYFLNRVSMSKFKQMRAIPEEEKVIPRDYLMKSNVYS